MTLFSGIFRDPSQPPPGVQPTSPPPQPTFSPTMPTSQPSSSSSSPFPSFSDGLDSFTSAYDPAKLHPLAGLGDNLDFLQLDEGKINDMQGAVSVLPSRGWTDDLCVGTGTTYLSGLAVGGMWGFREGFGRALGNNASIRLRLNSILNGCTRRGSFVGNSLGVLGQCKSELYRHSLTHSHILQHHQLVTR